MNFKILATLGPSSLNERTVKEMSRNNVSLFRINLSHTPLEMVSDTIKKIQSWTDIPIALDSEGAQIRNQNMESESVYFKEGDIVKIHQTAIIGNSNNISFTPNYILDELRKGDKIRVDFNTVCLEVSEVKKDHILAIVNNEGYVGSNKAADVNRHINLNAVTPKDEAAFKIGIELGINDFSLSFTNSAKDVDDIRKIIGYESNLIAKIESINGVLNLGEILPIVDQILIDRGDLSREIAIEKIPFIQRRIISYARSRETPVFVATNLLESMIKDNSPTRAEVNDVASTLLMGADGLVLAAETAIGNYPIDSVKMTNSIIRQYNRWTPESSCKDIIG